MHVCDLIHRIDEAAVGVNAAFAEEIQVVGSLFLQLTMEELAKLLSNVCDQAFTSSYNSRSRDHQSFYSYCITLTGGIHRESALDFRIA